MADTAFKIQQLYIALFGRVADPAGLKAWSAAVDSGAITLAGVGIEFGRSAEYGAPRSGESPAMTAARIEQLYQNMFDRAPDAGGLAYWSKLLSENSSAGAQAAGQLIAPMIIAAKGADLDVLNARTAAAMALTAALDTGAEIAAYQGPQAHAIARAYLDQVHDAASLGRATTPFALKLVSDGIVNGNYAGQQGLAEWQVQKLYVSYLGRAADVQALASWSQVLDGDPDSPVIDQMAAMFGQSAEYKSLFTAPHTAALINKAYNDMFNRDADVNGLTFWLKQIDTGVVDKAAALAAIADGAQGNDLFVLNARTQVATAITAAAEMFDQAGPYSSPPTIATVRQYIAGVVDAASLQVALEPSTIQLLFFSTSGNLTLVGSPETDLLL